MSRNNEANGDEPLNKRRRTENGDLYDGSAAYGAYGNYASSIGSQSQYGGYGPAGAIDSSPKVTDHMHVPATQQPSQAPPPAYMGITTQRNTHGGDSNHNIAPQLREPERVGIVEDLQARVSHLEKLLKADHSPREDEESQSTKTGAAEVLVDLRRSHSSAMNPKRSIIHQVCRLGSSCSTLCERLC